MCILGGGEVGIALLKDVTHTLGKTGVNRVTKTIRKLTRGKPRELWKRKIQNCGVIPQAI